MESGGSQWRRQKRAVSLGAGAHVLRYRRYNGWKNLITRVRVNAGNSYYAELPYDGRTYPTNPSLAPAMPLRRPESGTAYLEWNSNEPRAHALACDATY